ncbi:hypothetical protein HDU77_008961 [Chytriomyces hyalinus]|nr:hypothetical protein HDU77_008961 [Chytriomyces hyalinus]
MANRTRSLSSSIASVMKSLPTILSPIEDTDFLEMEHCLSFLLSRSASEYQTADTWFRVPADPTKLALIIRLGYKAYFRESRVLGGENFLVAAYLTHLLEKLPDGLIAKSVQHFIMDVHATVEGTHLSETDLQLIRSAIDLCPMRRTLIEQIARLGNKMVLSCPAIPASNAAVFLPLASEQARRRSIEKHWGDDSEYTRFTWRTFKLWRRKEKDAEMMENVFGFLDRWNQIVGGMFLEPDHFF